jgi:hypothetical protein
MIDQAVGLHTLLQSSLKVWVVSLARGTEVGEQVSKEGEEERDILSNHLGEVHLSECAVQQERLSLRTEMEIVTLGLSSCSQHSQDIS